MRKPSDTDLHASLTLGHFGGDGGPLLPSDPLTPTAMIVAVTQIDSYDRNPRRAPNEKFEELKESIRLHGVRQPLVITRRPGAPHYMPKHGGNTRLTILKDLLAETGDQRYAKANCLFEPWSTEADVLIGHLMENELRGDLVFIDKARAIRDAKLLIEQESGSAVSMRQLAEILRSRGYRVSHTIVSYCEYAVDILAGAIPRALNAGLGKPAIQKLRVLDGAALAVWEHRDLGPEALYRSIFAEAVTAIDHEFWDFDQARRALAEALAERAGTETRHILLEIGAEIAGVIDGEEDDDATPIPQQTVDEIESAEPCLPSPSDSPSKVDATGSINVHASSDRAPGGFTAPTSRNITAPQNRNLVESAPREAPRRSVPGGSDVGDLADAGHEPDEDHSTLRIQQLRRALGECAREYAAHSELGYCLRFEGSPWIRLGYIVADFPAPAQMSQLRGDFVAREALAWKWYELTRCCDLLPIAGHIERLYGQDAVTKERVFAELFGANPRYLKAWSSPDAFLDAISDSVGIMDLQQFSFYAERADENTWQAGIRMLQAYRELKAYAANGRIDLMQDQLAGADEHSSLVLL